MAGLRKASQADFITPLSFVWPVILILPLHVYGMCLDPGVFPLDPVLSVLFFGWLPFYWIYLIAYVLFTFLHAKTARTVLSSTLVALATVGCGWLFFFWMNIL